MYNLSWDDNLLLFANAQIKIEACQSFLCNIWFQRIKWILLVVIVIANWPTVTLKFLFVLSKRKITSWRMGLTKGLRIQFNYSKTI